MNKTPILIITYNRPKLTHKLVEFMNNLSGYKFYVFNDGPKNKRDEKLVDSVRKEIKLLNGLHKTNFQKSNLGCQKGVETAIDWVFDENDRAIIIEDDIILDKSFFPFAEELLARYEDDDRVMMISADNLIYDSKMPYSYFFSKHSSIWGWATWKRSWKKYHLIKKEFNILEKHKYLLNINHGVKSKFKYFISAINGSVDTWDFIWDFSLKVNSGLCIYPKYNLAKNKGFGKNATHTKYLSKNAFLETCALKFPLSHPPFVFANEKYEKEIEYSNSKISLISQLLKYKILSVFHD